MLKRFFVFNLILLLTACSPHSVRFFNKPNIDPPVRFSNIEADTNSTKTEVKWWENFNDKTLNKLILAALDNNLNLQAAWERLRQAQEQAVIAGSELYPQLSVSGTGSRSRFVNPELQGALSVDSQNTIYFNDFAIRNGLSFEVDIWKRVLSGKRAQEYRAEAARADAENTALLLTGAIANSWFNLNKQEKLTKLISEQIDSNKVLLELAELRFSLGKGTALDVFQQRQQLQSVKAEAPQIKTDYESFKNQLAVLLGKTLNSVENMKIAGNLPALPKFPGFISPAELIDYRPDLLAYRARLQAQEYDLAKAVAERFPRLALGLNYDFKASQVEDVLDRQQGSIFGNLLLPLIDGGRRRAVVRLNESQVNEQIKLFDNQFIIALADVETAISKEKSQAELVKLLKQQLVYAKATLDESQNRYRHGLTEYIQVVLALQSLQSLERRYVNESANLLNARVKLHLAIGGRWQDDSSPKSGEVKL
ncbi:MAG: efflux transporter outer membrane subunit [Bdellovibrionales bacterium]|nr:efflux transporter outer membrane subunit [Bdellovibrionales bacterium]